jgi:predicted Zn-dependent protease
MNGHNMTYITLKTGLYYWISRSCGKRYGHSRMRINVSRLLTVLTFASIFLISCGENRTVLTQKANEALESGQLDSAKQLYNKVIDLQPESPDAIEGLLSVATISNVTEDQVYWSQELLQYRPWNREANIIIGKSLMDEGNLKDAAIRLMLAYQNSVFKNEKTEVEELLQQVVIQTHDKYAIKQDFQNDSIQP